MELPVYEIDKMGKAMRDEGPVVVVNCVWVSFRLQLYQSAGTLIILFTASHEPEICSFSICMRLQNCAK